MYNDENVIKIKHDVLYEVAKLAFDGTLEEKRDFIPEKLIPGPMPQFRCCIYNYPPESTPGRRQELKGPGRWKCDSGNRFCL